MSDLAEKLKAQAMTLPPDERAEMGYLLLDSVGNGADANGEPGQLSDELRAELDRRMAAAEANPQDVVTWDEIVAHVRRT